MNIIPLEKKYYSIAQDFLQTYEKYSVILSFKLFKNPEWIYLVTSKDKNISSNDILGILSVNRTVLHCLPFAFHSKNHIYCHEFISIFSEFAKNRKIECINGESFGSQLIIAALQVNKILPATTNNYDLMELDITEFSELPLPELPKDHSIIRCKKTIPSEYKNQLLELQKQYEIEEVLPPSMEFSELACKIRLKNSLQNQYVLSLKTNTNKLVAKAATNAIGTKYIQLGGIFTHPEFRQKGFSYSLIFAILKRIIKINKSAILFVKKSNIPAKNLYKSLRFKKIGDYIISYFVYNN